jgi:hypothetical protein
VKIISVFAVGLALAGTLSTAPAQAQATRTFVSPTGNDASVSCSLAAPCRTFQAAHDVTNPGGEIAVLGTAGYGALTINKAISIVNPGAFEAGIIVPSGSTGIVINAGASDTVSLRGLSIEGGGVGITGIAFGSGKSLTIQNAVIRNLTGSGIAIAPSTAANITVSNTFVTSNGGHGIYVQPASNITVNAVFNRVEAYSNGQMGIGMFGNLGPTTNIMALAIDCVVAHNGSAGYYALGNGSTFDTRFKVFRSAAFNNDIGASAQNGALVVVSQSNLEGNNTANWAESTGAVTGSYGDNYTENVISPGTIFPLR